MTKNVAKYSTKTHVFRLCDNIMLARIVKPESLENIHNTHSGLWRFPELNTAIVIYNLELIKKNPYLIEGAVRNSNLS